MRGGTRTVSNDSRVHNQGEKSSLVLGRVLLQESLGVVVADGLIFGTLSRDCGGSSQDGEVGVTHVDGMLKGPSECGFRLSRCFTKYFT